MVSKNATTDGKSAVVVGGGIGGLAAAVALRQAGWQVTVLERAARFGEIGAGITLLSNGLRCLDAIGLGDAVRGSGLPMLAIGMRTAAGRWLSRIDGDGAGLEARTGTTTLTIHRAELHKILRDTLQAEALIPGVATTAIHGGADALAHYDRERRVRTQAMSQAATRQLRFGQQLHNPIAVAVRNTAVALTPDRIALLAIARYGKWRPPALDCVRSGVGGSAST